MTSERLVGVPRQVAFALPPDLARRWWPALWGGALGAGVFVATWRAMPDDALITLSFARNLIDRGEWAITPGLEVNTATSPLMVWLLAGLYVVVGKHAIVAAGLLLAACYAGIALMLHRLAGGRAALLGSGLLATSPLLTASTGMESVPAVALLLALVVAAHRQRWPAVAVLTAAAPLLRPDLAVGAIAVLAVCAAVHRTWSATVQAAVAGLVIVLPWYAFSWWHFGSLWPLTVPVKALQPGWGDESASLATIVPFEFRSAAAATLIVVVGVLAGAAAAVAAARRGRWPDGAVPAALVIGGVGEYATLTAAATTPVIYYPGILVGAAACALALVAGGLRRWWAPAVLLIAAGLVYLVVHASDLAHGYHPLRQNWATNDQYAQLVAELPTDAPVMSPGEIGALSYYCLDRGCRVVDPFLADPGRVDVWVGAWLRRHPWTAANYRHLPVVPATVAPHRIVFELQNDPAWPPLPGYRRPGDVAVLGGNDDPGWARVGPADEPPLVGDRAVPP